ncbi:hypothetical protein BDY24DRAFT_393800 [Mrakia frigida]|uniref:uncharacterized protein n=1 Tax=Mrakia frigida TaxID=29902 RepID=UPI003FCBF76F
MVSLLLPSTTLRSLASHSRSRCSSLASTSSSLPRSFSSTPLLCSPRPEMYPPFDRPHPDEPYRPRKIPTYPSRLNSQPKLYKKEQRAAWHGPESEFDIGAPKTFEDKTMFVNPEHPMYLTEPDAKPSRWFVTRTQAGDYLPVYTEYKNSTKTNKQTIIRHIEGDPHLLLDNLLRYLITLRPDEKRTVGRVVAASGVIEIKGIWKREIIEFLLSRGM